MKIEHFSIQVIHEAREVSLWCELDGHPFVDWRGEVENEDTTLGYWAWAEERSLSDLEGAPEELKKATEPASGLCCPRCGDGRQIAVRARIWALVDEHGSDIQADGLERLTGYDHEWDDDDACRCPTCEHAGTVKTFTP